MARRYKRRYVFTLVYLILSVIVFVVLNAIPGNFAQRPLPISGWLLVVVIFGGAFLFLLIWGIIQFFVQDYILENGDLVEGRVIEHDDVPGRGFSRNYYLTYRYEYRGEPHTKEQRVSKETYRQIPDGTRISVRCLPDNPKRAQAVDFYIVQNEVLVEGRIIEHREALSDNGSRDYYLTYRYEYRGEPYTKEQRVSKETYRQIPDGTRISVRCLPDNPKRARISDEAVTQGTKWPPKTT